MSERRFLGRSGNTVEILHHDHDRLDTLIVQEIENVEPALAEARRRREERPGNELRHVAVIPEHVLNRAFREGWFNDPAAWRAWANDPDNRAFRTWQGRV